MSIIARYVVGQYLKVFGLCMLAATGLFLVVDFFQRVGNLLSYDPGVVAIASYFLFKIPSILSDIYPACALLAVLISLGLLSRHKEMLALRACGVGTATVAAPLLAVAAVFSMVALVGNLTVVPGATAHSRRINDVVIKKKAFRGLYNVNSLWFQGQEGFFNVDYFDANSRALYGLTLYETGPTFELNRIVEVPMVRWRNDRWEISEGTVKNFGPEGEILARPLEPGEFGLDITLDELLSNRRQPAEFNYRQLREQIRMLESRGLSADSFRVDLHVKMAWPMSGLLMLLVGIPLAVRKRRRSGLSYNLIAGLLVGFGYWVTMAVAVSAGRNGGISPFLAAWTANGMFTLLGAAFYLWPE
ncbi:MAG: LPS export ABC transporter permease LptG [Candidatus Binatia bacterium]